MKILFFLFLFFSSTKEDDFKIQNVENFNYKAGIEQTSIEKSTTASPISAALPGSNIIFNAPVGNFFHASGTAVQNVNFPAENLEKTTERPVYTVEQIDMNHERPSTKRAINF